MHGFDGCPLDAKEVLIGDFVHRKLRDNIRLRTNKKRLVSEGVIGFSRLKNEQRSNKVDVNCWCIR